MKKQKVKRYKLREIAIGHFASVGANLLISVFFAFKDSNSLEVNQVSFILSMCIVFIHIIYFILGSSSYFLSNRKVANQKYSKILLFFLPLLSLIFFFIVFLLFEINHKIKMAIDYIIIFDVVSFLVMNITMLILWILNYWFLNKKSNSNNINP